MERKEGYYWVKFNSEWIIMFYKILNGEGSWHAFDWKSCDTSSDTIDETPITRNETAMSCPDGSKFSYNHVTKVLHIQEPAQPRIISVTVSTDSIVQMPVVFAGKNHD